MYPAGMSTATDPIRPVDVVADVVAATRRGTAVYCRALLHAPWGLQLAATPIASVHVVTGGACWLIPDGGDPIHLAQGDVAPLPGGAAHVPPAPPHPRAPGRRLRAAPGGRGPDPPCPGRRRPAARGSRARARRRPRP